MYIYRHVSKIKTWPPLANIIEQNQKFHGINNIIADFFFYLSYDKLKLDNRGNIADTGFKRAVTV